jgi:putative transferase (TIGR04331 family)
MIEFCDQFRIAKSPKAIFSSFVTYNEEFKFWTAKKTEEGASLNLLQHGGGYGIGKWFSNEDHEINIADHFFSWGWEKGKFTKVVPLGMLKGNLFKKRTKYDQDYALLILGNYPRYSYKLYSEVVSKQWLNYFNDQTTFICSLSDDLRDKLRVKLYQKDYGWNDSLRFKDEFPDVCFIEGNTSIGELSKQSRVIISTYNSTSFLETIAANIPSIVYWDPSYWELRDDAIPYFQELRKVGVFHESPESAAMQLNNVWDNVFDWWNSHATQEAVINFANTFCYTSPDMLKELMLMTENTNSKREKVAL